MAWDRELVLAQKEYLSEVYERTKDVRFQDSVSCLDDILDFDNFKFYEQNAKFTLKKLENIDTLIMFQKFLPDIEDAFHLDSLFTERFINEIPKRLITEEELLSFANDFFKVLDKELYMEFLEVYKHRNYNFKRSNNRACTITVGGFGFSYLNIESVNEIEEFFSTAHEYGHAIHNRICYRSILKDNYPFHELLSFFSEYVSLLYYEQRHPEDLEDIKSNKKVLLMTILINISRIMYYYRVVYYNNLTKLGMVLKVKSVNKVSFCKARETVEESLYERFVYTIPFLTVIELLYTGDLEKSVYILKELIKLPNGIDYKSALQDNGIILTEHLADFIKYTEKNHDSKILRI